MVQEKERSNGIILVLDTGALLAKYYRYVPRLNVELYTPSSAVSEVRDQDNKQALEEALNLDLIKTITPSKRYLEKARRIVSEIGLLPKLSRVDIDIVALALQLKATCSNREIVVITDDYDLQNILLYLKISFKPLRTNGIREVRLFKTYCPVCKYTPGEPGVEYCPICGSKIITTRIT